MIGVRKEAELKGRVSPLEPCARQYVRVLFAAEVAQSPHVDLGCMEWRVAYVGDAELGDRCACLSDAVCDPFDVYVRAGFVADERAVCEPDATQRHERDGEAGDGSPVGASFREHKDHALI